MLRPGGCTAFFVIHTPAGLGPAAAARAVELGPTYVGAKALPWDLAREAGFTRIERQDLTEEFRDTCMDFQRVRRRLEPALRAAEGDEAFEEEQAKKANLIRGIEEGLLQRSLIAAFRP